MTDVGPSILTKGRFLRLPDALKCTMETSWRLSLNLLSVTILMQTLTCQSGREPRKAICLNWKIYLHLVLGKYSFWSHRKMRSPISWDIMNQIIQIMIDLNRKTFVFKPSPIHTGFYGCYIHKIHPMFYK